MMGAGGWGWRLAKLRKLALHVKKLAKKRFFKEIGSKFVHKDFAKFLIKVSAFVIVLAIDFPTSDSRKTCNNCRCKFEDHQVTIPGMNVPKKLVKKKIIVDAGGEPNYPSKSVPRAEETSTNQSSQSIDDLGLPAPPQDLIEIEDLNNQARALSMATVNVTVPKNGGHEIQVNGGETKGNGKQPVADNVRKSFMFVPDGANEETVRIFFV